MENIVAHSLEKLYMEFEKADQIFLDSGMEAMAAYEERLAEAARRSAAGHMQELYNSLDRALCNDILRDAKYTIQRHDTKELLTVDDPVRFTHTLFYNKEDDTYHYLLDEWLGLDAHEMLNCTAEKAVLVEAAKNSYSRAARVLGKGAEISKTAVMDKVHAIPAELPFEKPDKKKCVEHLYIEADEDHIHKQEKTGAGKKGGMTGKLLYLYEDSEEKNGRRELKYVFYLGGLYAGSGENHRLFRRIQEYIGTNYETKYLKKVYVSGDCEAWIKTGIPDIDKSVMVMDKYHLMKYINKAANQMLDDGNEVKGRLWKALYKNDREAFSKTLDEVRGFAQNKKTVDECEEYVLNNWKSAVLRMRNKNVYGCSAEEHVSHVYSARMSSRSMG